MHKNFLKTWRAGLTVAFVGSLAFGCSNWPSYGDPPWMEAPTGGSSGPTAQQATDLETCAIAECVFELADAACQKTTEITCATDTYERCMREFVDDRAQALAISEGCENGYLSVLRCVAVNPVGCSEDGHVYEVAPECAALEHSALEVECGIAG